MTKPERVEFDKNYASKFLKYVDDLEAYIAHQEKLKDSADNLSKINKVLKSKVKFTYIGHRPIWHINVERDELARLLCKALDKTK